MLIVLVRHRITRGSIDGYNHRSLTLTPDGRLVISGGGLWHGSGIEMVLIKRLLRPQHGSGR